MKYFFKTLVTGIIYTLLSPVFVAIFLLVLAYIIVNIIFTTILIPFRFFGGKPIFGDPKLEQLENKKNEKFGHTQAPAPTNVNPNPTFNTQIPPQGPVNNFAPQPYPQGFVQQPYPNVPNPMYPAGPNMMGQAPMNPYPPFGNFNQNGYPQPAFNYNPYPQGNGFPQNPYQQPNPNMNPQNPNNPYDPNFKNNNGFNPGGENNA
jgi:hypothetical protein